MLNTDEIINSALNSLFDLDNLANIHDVVNDVNDTFSDVHINYNDVISVADRCMSFQYNDACQSVELV